jgi:hypothetical protein
MITVMHLCSQLYSDDNSNDYDHKKMINPFIHEQLLLSGMSRAES